MVFILLAYFTLYNGLQFHPSHVLYFLKVLSGVILKLILREGLPKVYNKSNFYFIPIYLRVIWAGHTLSVPTPNFPRLCGP